MKRSHIFCAQALTLVKTICLSIFFTCAGIVSFGQTSNISGIVNTYHKVTQVIPAKACLRVANPTGLTVNTMVMVVQMKGATINTSTGSGFGDTLSLNGAGNYEIGTICYIIGDSVFLFHELLNSYDSSSKVQLVQFAEYYSANVMDTVKAMSWDSTSGLGGVIAIFAEEDLTLTKPIWADSSGYSGGSYFLSGSNCSNIAPATSYAYNASPSPPPTPPTQNGAYKGESVATITSTTITGGRGAPANGGGGGNNHNNSGGGGANLTGGGIGGGNSSTAGCTTTLRGLGGKALSSWSGTKIFSGGGGGAGHANNGFSSVHGGNGGGIIFIWANNLIGNNQFISADGGNGGDSQSDGAGGGGGAGTIIMNVTNYTGNAIIRANGGNGGNSADGGTLGRCYGGGGGGSGGAIYYSGSVPAITDSVDAGGAGVESGRDPGCAAAQAAADGNAGQIIPNYTFSRSTDPAGYCELLLPSKLLFFNARLNGTAVIVNWQVDHPELVDKFIVEKRTENNSWSELTSMNATDSRFRYGSIDADPSLGNNFYRLRIMEKDGSIHYSDIRKVWVAVLEPNLTIYPNPASDKIFISGKLQAGGVIRIVDMSGKIIWQQKVINSRTVISLSGMSPGIYLVQHNGMAKKLVIH